MTDEESLQPASVFFLSTVGFAMIAVPLVATLDSVAFGGGLGGSTIPVLSLVLAIPPALEFAFSRRDPYLVGKYVVAFVVLYFVAIVGQAVVYVALGIPEPIPAAEVLVLVAAYVVAYVAVYRKGYARLKRAMAG